MARHVAFRWSLDPTVEQQVALARHVGAARFAFNTCLELHLAARRRRHHADGLGSVPWSGFSLINTFNRWKRSEAAGRRFVVDSRGGTQVEVTGLAWRGQVCSLVFEEAAVDLGRALKAWTASRAGKRIGRRVGHPRFKKKNATSGSFRIRNQRSRTGRSSIRVGDSSPRSVSLPKLGTIRVREDTRRLRRMIAKQRARILYATVSRGVRGRWWISVTVEAADFHPETRHRPRTDDDDSGWVGVDRGLKDAVVAATSDGVVTLRVKPAKTLANGLPRIRLLSRAVSRKKKGSSNQKKARTRLAREHQRIRNRRQYALHQVSNRLVNNHDRLVLEDLNIAGMIKNRRLSRAISDAAWGELARQVGYKQAWRGGQVAIANRWFPSSKTCSACHTVKQSLTLAEREFVCDACGHAIDRDLNAAVNLAAWAHNTGGGVRAAGDRQTAGPVTNAH
ncbi:RNA-guided endonuclease InsQ/TnpB family protein [Myceligenerans pegani]|uniref:IS200/IS605 family element transposase accessory protein TnpB n=1 Tax=Myceligenerans pegani TaxID=2776917 RepID=A0ABR9N208_9MICO|nr:RNA-guided endonuclease TnpB family protein [Myceligenerans sp. TRM 65318]MBE1877179.1 IS200/IS605 family element transposase accessory protein TnpB [Myceligenerans sp. TRM 65318]MBE3019450.1 IS200/IS605 family element transposase accessory protein TnpB [Myceligenerans sp. TRM 65318]